MKTKLAVPFLLFALTACTTLYTGTVTITKVADTAMKAWADLSANGKTTPVIDSKVAEVHDNYRAACSVAHKALVAYKQSGDPEQYHLALDSAKLAAQELLDLITPLLVPRQADTLNTQLARAKTL